jgi:hypothetical protein
MAFLSKEIFLMMKEKKVRRKKKIESLIHHNLPPKVIKANVILAGSISWIARQEMKII